MFRFTFHWRSKPTTAKEHFSDLEKEVNDKLVNQIRKDYDNRH